MAIENGVQNAELGYILDPAFQIEGLNGKPVVGGWICIYEAGTDNKYISYENFDGAQNPFKVPLKSDGRAVILGDPSLSYDIYCYDSYGNQLFSRLNVQCNVPGTINLSGSDTRIKNTDGTLDISLRTQANNVREYTINTRNKELGVESPLYFARNDESATIIGFSGDGYLTEDKFEYDSNNHITAYNHSAFAAGAGSGTIYEAGDHIDITNSVISVTGLPDSADIENAISSAVTNIENKFEYNENNYITAYNNSAFAGKEYSAGDYVSIENDTISVTGLQPSGDYATKTDLSGKQDTLSAGDGITIVNNIISVTSQGGGIEQVNHDDTLSGNGNSTPLGIANIEDFVKHNDLTAYQEKGDYYSASNPSGFITNDVLTGLQPSGDYVTRDELTAYQPSGNYATIEDVESAVSGKQDILSAGEGIQIINNTISVTAQGGGGGITVVNHDNTLSGNGNSEPLGLANAEDYVKQDDLTGYATTALVSSVSSELYSAISGISGDFDLVAGSGVELVDDPYAKTTTINVTAEGTPVTAIEQMIESATSGISAAISGSYTLVAGDGIQLTDDDNARTTTVSVSGDYLSATESANYYPMTGNPSGFLTAVPTGTMNESAFEYDTGNKISGYNGSAFACGSEIPTAVSGYWQSASDTVCANSGVWGGSALQISAGPGIKFELVNDTLVASTNETVLYEGDLSGNGATAQLSEPIQNFERIKVYGHTDDGIQYPWFTEFYPIENTLMEFGVASNNAGWGKWFYFNITTGGLYTNMTGRVLTFGTTTWNNLDFYGTTKVIGVNRIAGGN